MERLKNENENSQVDKTLEELRKKKITNTEKNFICDNSTLKRVSKHLKQQKKKKGKLPLRNGCSSGNSAVLRVDRQVKLKCRQLPNVVEELRRAVMRQDWDEATTLVMLLCHPGLTYYSSLIIKVCLILVLSHPNSSLSLLQQFIRLTTDYILEEDVNKFIRILFALRKTALEPLKSGKYIRKTADYKVVRDPEFEKL